MQLNKRRLFDWRMVVLFAALSLAFVGADVAHAQVKFGVFGPLTGDAAAFGASMKEGIDLAVNEQNAKGGVLKQKIEVIYGDDAGKPEQAINIAKRFTGSDHVLVILGSTMSPTSMAVSQVAEDTETPQIIVGATAQRITLQGNPWVFRSAVPDVKLASDLVDFIHQKYPDKKKIGFIYINDDFGKGGLTAFKARAATYGLELVATEAYAPGDIDFTSLLSRIKSSQAEILVDWSRYTEASLIAKQYKRMGLNIPRFGCDGQSSPKFLELAGDAANGMYYATHFSVVTAAGNPVAMDFIKKFQAAYKKNPDHTAAQAYDAVHAAVFAIEKAGKPDRAAIRDALHTVQFDGTRGRFSFDKKGDPAFPTDMVLVKNGKETNARASN
jgi:branched-chain amino acid transport system substrate-binding protein